MLMHQWKKTNKPCVPAFTPYTPIWPQGNQDTRTRGWLTEQILLGSHMGGDVRAIADNHFQRVKKKKMKNEKPTLQTHWGWAPHLFFDAHQSNTDFHPLPSLPFQVFWTIIIHLFPLQRKQWLSVFYTEQYTDFTVKNADVTTQGNTQNTTTTLPFLICLRSNRSKKISTLSNYAVI